MRFNLTNGRDANTDPLAIAINGYTTGEVYIKGKSVNFWGATTYNSNSDYYNNKINRLGNGTADTDAINLGQLRGAVNTLGGGATINADGTVKAPTYTIQGSNYTDVGGALGKLDSGLSTANTNITNLTNNLNNGSVGLVRQAKAGDDITVAKDTNGARVNFAGTAGNRVLSGVARGVADTEAVNVSQLKGVVSAIGGGSVINTDGTIKAPSYAIQGGSYDNVGDALSKLDGGLTNANTNITNLTNNLNNGSVGLVQQAKAGDNLTVAKDKDGDKVDFTGKFAKLGADGKPVLGTDGKPVYENKDRVLTGVAKGAADNDAVNVKQLKDAGIVNADGSSLNAVVYDSNAKNSITLGGGTGGTTIKNVAKGISGTDAANVDQLKGLASALGGGAGMDSSGNITQPKYDVQGQSRDGVDGAVKALDNGLTNANTNITNLTNNLNNGSTGLVRQAAAGANITVAKDTDGDKVDFTGKFAQLGADGKPVVGTDGKPVTVSKDRVLTGVAKGAADNDAVNVKQLKDAGIVNADGTSLNAVVYDSNAKNSITLGGGTGGTTIKNVAKGISGTDAANVDQLKGLASALGGGAGVDPSGNITQPKYDVQGQSRDGVDGAVKALDNGLTNANTNINNLTNNLNSGSVGLVQQAKAGDNLTVGKDIDGKKVNFAGTFEEDDPAKPGTKKKVVKNRALTGVDDGVDDNDAVNISQLKKTGLFNDKGESLNAVIYDDATKSRVTFGGGLNGTVLANVAPGLISKDSMQAINGSQLFAMRTDLQGKIDGLDGRVDTLENKVLGDGNGNNNIGNGNNVGPGGSNGSNGSNGNPGGNGSNGSNGTPGSNGNNGSPGTPGTPGVGTPGTPGAPGANGNNALGNNNNLVGPNGDGSNNLGLGNNNDPGGNNSQGIGNGNKVPGDNSIGQGNNNVVPGNNSQGQGNNNNVPGNESLAIGNRDDVPGDKSQGIGNDNKVPGNNSIGQGNNNEVPGNNSIAEGNNNKVPGNNSIAEGNNNTVAGNNAVGTGFGNNVAGDNGIGIGNGTNVGGHNGIAVGTGAQANGNNSVAIGPGARAPADDAVALGSNSLADRNNTISVGSAGHERQITNVAPGRMPTDAVNLGQLNNAIGGVNQRVEDVWQQARKWNRQANQGIAAASALVNNMPYVPGRVALSAGVATYRGESALGIAASRWSEDGRVNVNAGVSFAGNSAPIFRVGVGVVL